MTDQEKQELDFLRYFYDQVDDALGPASWTIYRNIAGAYSGVVPLKYRDEDEEEDEG